MKKKDILKKWTDNCYLRDISTHLESICSNRAEIEDTDLSGITIGPDAILDILKSKNLYQATIKNSNLSHSKISGSMSNVVFNHVDLSCSNLDRCVMVESRFLECNFSHAKLIAKLNDSIFENTDFSFSKITGGTLGLEYGGRRVKFISCCFNGAVFNRVEFRASRFLNCNFSGAKFINCDFRGVKAEGEILPSKSQFEKMEIPDWFL